MIFLILHINASILICSILHKIDRITLLRLMHLHFKKLHEINLHFIEKRALYGQFLKQQKEEIENVEREDSPYYFIIQK